MDLSTSQQILVIFLSTALAVLLVLAIAVAIAVLKLVKTLREIAAKAEKVVESAEAVGEVFKKAAGPLGLLRFLANMVEMVKHKAETKHKD